MRILLLLALLPLVAMAGERSVVKQSYIDEVQYKIENIIDKRRLGVATDYDAFMLDKLSDRLADLSGEAAPRVVFTSAIDDREPTEHLQNATADTDRIYLFTEIRGQTGKEVRHVWYADGKLVYTQKFGVKGDRWRIWSAKSLNGAKQLTVLVYAGDELIAVTGLEVI
jgi:hypothetical protein